MPKETGTLKLAIGQTIPQRLLATQDERVDMSIALGRPVSPNPESAYSGHRTKCRDAAHSELSPCKRLRVPGAVVNCRCFRAAPLEDEPIADTRNRSDG